MREIGIYGLALALGFGDEALARSMSSPKGPPRAICLWGTTQYPPGGYCSTACAGGVCEVQLCLNDGSFMLIGTCRGSTCKPECS